MNTSEKVISTTIFKDETTTTLALETESYLKIEDSLHTQSTNQNLLNKSTTNIITTKIKANEESNKNDSNSFTEITSISVSSTLIPSA